MLWANCSEYFWLFLFGVELQQAVKAFLEEEIVHVEIVVLVAIIAIARKVIAWEFKELSAMETFALSGMMLVLAVTYYLIKHTDFKCRICLNGEKKEQEQNQG